MQGTLGSCEELGVVVQRDVGRERKGWAEPGVEGTILGDGQAEEALRQRSWA